jgi:FKBP-type peptidyl-prolyl cis-trans isomerase
MPAYFRVYEDRLFIGSTARYHIEKHTEHLLWFRGNDGELVKLAKDDKSEDNKELFEHNKPQILSLTDVLKKDTVVNYEGKLIDGTVFDASNRHGDKPAEFQVGRVIKGWQEALKAMPAGSEWEIYIPQELAYGAQQSGQIPPFSTLIFKVELVAVK